MKEMLSFVSKYYRFFILTAIATLATLSVKATHIRAAEITVERIGLASDFRFRFTVTAIRDTGSEIQFGQGVFDFGDGTTIDGGFEVETTLLDSGDELELNVFTVEHTYGSVGNYIVSYLEENRNAGILNMNNSVNTPFYVESQIKIDVAFGVNNSPVMTVLPIDKGGQFVTFFHNPGAFDPDGDSLSYELTIPKQGNGFEVFDYVFPNDPRFYGDNFLTGNEAQDSTPTFDIDAITGTLKWDAPGEPGEYNVAFIIREWRKIGGEWFTLGFVTRDMQIIIEETDNEKPELEVPEEICVEAGETVNELVIGTDPDGHPVLIEAFGGPFEVPLGADITPSGVFQNVPASSNFIWNTDCSHVQERPYEVIVKITDDPDEGPKLVNFETWRITVVGPAPEGLVAETEPNETISLSWDPYVCSNADSMEVWRRVDSFDLDIDDCEVGMPGFAGYQMIDLLDISQNTYLDDNKGLGLAAGAKYCYRLVARYPDPRGGTSYVSEEACDTLIANGPVITNVDIDKTGETDGEIIIKWAPPFDLDASVFAQPFQYDVIRFDGQSGESNRLNVTRTTDTIFTDTGLNTLDQRYHYKIILLDGNDQILDSTLSAAAVRLELSPEFESIELTWGANVPWSNRAVDYPYHYIFRDRVNSDPTELVLIDSVNITESGFSYLDDGRFNTTKLDDELEYCYYVSTQGVYGNVNLDEPFINRSQIFCEQPNDTISPCTPVLFSFDPELTCEALLSSNRCNFETFRNHLLWEEDSDSSCDNDIESYNVYFSESGDEDDFEMIANVFTTEFYHEDLPSLKGCYRITSIDRSGNESIPTEIFCNDNCPQYLLPNAFSPNGDQWNEFFTPLTNDAECPRFVKSVVFTIFDRTGNKVFDYNSDEGENSIFINWDGKSNAGINLPAGTYFYTADVEYDRLEIQDNKEQFKGWIQLMK